MTLRESDNLNLPDAPDFVSTEPQYSLPEMVQLCEKMLPYWNKLRYSRPEPQFIGESFRLLEEPSERDL